MRERKAFILSPFRYLVPASYEKWFESLAAGGWHPKKIGQMSSVLMRFEKGDPKRYRYVVDLQAFPNISYIKTYEDFGWEYVGKMASIFIWRKEYEGERPESFTDAENIKKRSMRFFYAISFSFFIMLAASIIITASYLFLYKSLDSSLLLQFYIGGGLSYIFTLLFGTAMLFIYKNKEM